MVEQAAGGVVYRWDEAIGCLVLLIQDKYGVWTLPKGHVEPGETLEAAAGREIFEETGVYCRVEALIAQVEYPVYKKGRWRDKRVVYFLAAALSSATTPATDEGISEVHWFRPAEALASIGYVQVREVLRS